jgi:hypothetical protein
MTIDRNADGSCAEYVIGQIVRPRTDVTAPCNSSVLRLASRLIHDAEAGG